MKCLIAGSRGFDDYAKLADMMYIVVASKGPITEVISGTARGADTLGERWAKEHNLPITRMPADWDKYGKSAGYRRNKEMVDICDIVVLFWDGKSKGTEHTMRLAHQMNKSVFIYTYGNAELKSI